MPLPLANPPARSRAATRRASIPVAVLAAPALLRLWHLASLDAPTVAVVWSLGFAWAAGILLPQWVPFLLALGTWAVYIGDRLMDARTGIRSGALESLRERHFFHWRHRRTLVPLAVTAAGAAAAIIFAYMPPVIRAHNSVLAAAALAYFSGVHSRRQLPRAFFLAKEFLVGVLFTAGCAVPVLSRLRLTAGADSMPWLVLAPIVFFAALAWLNCHAIEHWESGETSRIPATASLLGLAGVTMAVLMAPAQPRPAALLAAGAASALLLALLDRARGRLAPLALRAAADLVLLTPLVLLAR